MKQLTFLVTPAEKEALEKGLAAKGLKQQWFLHHALEKAMLDSGIKVSKPQNESNL